MFEISVCACDSGYCFAISDLSLGCLSMCLGLVMVKWGRGLNRVAYGCCVTLCQGGDTRGVYLEMLFMGI